jgi:opacity protein-like surface antigen
MAWRAAVAVILGGVTAASPASAEKMDLRAGFHAGFDEINSRSAAVYGFFVGADFPLSDQMFLGIEANAEKSGLKSCVVDEVVAGDRECEKHRYDLGAVGRIGANAGRIKLYALAGYANLNVRAMYTAPGISLKDTVSADGARVGAGVELPVDLEGRVKVKLEYRYSHYEHDIGGRHQVLSGFALNF